MAFWDFEQRLTRKAKCPICCINIRIDISTGNTKTTSADFPVQAVNLALLFCPLYYYFNLYNTLLN